MSTAAIDALLSDLAALPESDRCFNPYAGESQEAVARRANLARYLGEMQTRRPDVLLLAEAPGYRGCALTGIPVTSERVMSKGLARWGIFGAGYRPASGVPGGISEMTATILWGALEAIAPEPPLIWNTFPLHPHRPGERRSNRTPSSAEQRTGEPFVLRIAGLFGIRRFLAMGRVAQRVLGRLGLTYVPLRHPAQGGKAEFVAALQTFYHANDDGITPAHR